MIKKIGLKLIIIILSALFLVTTAVFATAFSLVSDESAEAAVGWKVRVTRMVNVEGKNVYVDIPTGQPLTEAGDIYFMVSDYNAGDNFFYYVFDGKDGDISANMDINNSGWGAIGAKADDTIVVDGVTYRYVSYSCNEKTTLYIYFRRQNSQDSTGVVDELYSKRAHRIPVNITLSEDMLGIEEVSATYLQNNRPVNYVGGWIGSALTFTVTTKYMSTNETTYDSGNELLAYSVDGKPSDAKDKLWIPMTSNRVKLERNLKDSTVVFRVTNIDGKHPKYYQFPIKISMDIVKPQFSVTAMTADANGNATAYSSGDWTSSRVTFTLNSAAERISAVDYYVSTDGANYESIGRIAADGAYVVYNVNGTMHGLRFRAVNAAGVVYDYEEVYNVNIDDKRPGVAIEAFTPNPETEGARENIPLEIELDDENAYLYRAAAANGQVILRLYNRTSDGKPMSNASGTTYYYAVKADDGEFSEFRKMTSSALDNASYTYYTITDSFTSGVSSKRVYAFYIESDAGLRSNTIYLEVTILNSYFEIDVQEITYTPNGSGWSAEPIPVYVNVPTDQKAIRDEEGKITGYTTPTTEYEFFYTPTNISGALFSAKGEYYAPIEGEDGRSTYVFRLSASAESVFVIYAKNAAGKESANRFTSLNVIKIDTVAPTVEHTAYINPVGDVKELTYIRSGDWVNGSIVLEISVKQGVSGVYLKELMSVFDAGGNEIWIDGDTLTATGGVVNGYQIYRLRINLENSAETVMSKMFKFRAYTNSGVYRDVEFLANIDTSGISLTAAELELGGKTQRIESDESQSGVFNFNPICENGRITLFSNREQQGHFYCYIKETADGEYSRLDDDGFDIGVPPNSAGTITRYLYIVSRAVDYAGNSVATEKSLPFVIRIPYNTMNLTVSVSLETDFQGVGAGWVDDDVTVKVTLKASEEGAAKALTEEEKKSYTYYYMLIPFGVNINEAMNNDDEWQRIAEGSWETAQDGGTERVFKVPFDDKSFYGNVAVTVANEAGYRTSGIRVEQVMRIDRTRPVIEDMIVQTTGEKETQSGGVVTYYSNNTITIHTPSYEEARSPISYYYAQIEKTSDDTGWLPAPITGNPDPDSGALNGWTKLESQYLTLTPDSETKYSEYSFVFYAVNGVGKTAGGVSDGAYTRYLFVLDGSVLGGELSYDRNSGATFDPSLNMVAFMWKNNVKISVKVTNSNTKVRYYYSTDGKKDEDPTKEWTLYLDGDEGPESGGWRDAGGNKPENLIFNDKRFEETGGIVSEFSFKAENKAGAIRYFGTKIFIAIDATKPDFNVITTVDGLEYIRDGVDNLAENNKYWSNKPVTITISPTTENVGGCFWEYTVLCRNAQEATTRRPLPGLTFTTDRLDGFDKNNDAIITVYATNRANGKETEKKIRVKVDQVEPVFTINGQASNEIGGGGKIISSDQWTNFANVNLNTATDAMHYNVSGVTFTYTYSEPENPEPQPKGEFPGSGFWATKICTVTVTAVSGANLMHTESFKVNIDRDKPKIEFDTPYVVENEKHYIDIRVKVLEENLEICEFITVKGAERGFAFNPTGHIISTSSVDNSERIDPKDPDVKYRGYVKLYARDFAGNESVFELYMLPFGLDVNNVTLSDQDQNMIAKYKRDLEAASKYMDPSRVTYFENLIARLDDRIGTITREIAVFQDYLARVSQKTSFELRSDYSEMYSYMKQYRDYAEYGQAWVQKAIVGEPGSDTYDNFATFEKEFETLQGRMNEVYTVEDRVKKLPAINMVEAEDYYDVVSVHNNYRNLTLDQKACFNANLYNKVTTLKKRCEILLMSDAATGVSVDANFAPDAHLTVESVKSTDSTYINAQAAIMSQKKDDVARAVISVFNVRLTGAASQTETGRVTVTLPIPEEYRQYIYFAVYTLSSDGGSLGDISDMKINGTGRSVTFTHTELTTFVLAVRANIETNSGNENETYGTILGLPLDVEMIKTIAIIGATLFFVILVVVIIVGIRHKRFLNTYNRAYKSSIYRRGVQKIPKGNTVPKMNPLKPDERVREQKKPY